MAAEPGGATSAGTVPSGHAGTAPRPARDPATDDRAGQLITTLGLQPHPEGGWYREIFRSAATVQLADGRPARSALTSIDFLLRAGQCSAWHRVLSDEAWHLLEGGPLRLWLLSPDLQQLQPLDLGTVDGQGRQPRAVVPAGWWQAAEPAPGAAMAYVGATVGPGFDFADFAFGRDDPTLPSALAARWPDTLRLL